MKKTLSIKEHVYQYLLITVGCFIMTLGFGLFINPYSIVPGGIFAVALVAHTIVPAISTGIFALAMNIPLILIGIKILGAKFGIKTIFGIVISSVFMDLITHFAGEVDPLGLADDLLLSCIFGGIFIGGGLGLIFKADATSGGADIIAMILTKYAQIPIGQSIIIVDTLIVLIGLVVFKDWKIPLYSWLCIYIVGQIVNVVINGLQNENILFIISDKHQEIKQKILVDSDRGGTFLKGEGMYTGNEKNVIFLVLSRREVPIMKNYIHQIDPCAFISIVDSHETLGEGFKPLKEGETH